MQRNAACTTNKFSALWCILNHLFRVGTGWFPYHNIRIRGIVCSLAVPFLFLPSRKIQMNGIKRDDLQKDL